eukprot:jgi/Tetstr1/425294/TSEL_015745.t1
MADGPFIDEYSELACTKPPEANMMKMGTVLCAGRATMSLTSPGELGILVSHPHATTAAVQSAVFHFGAEPALECPRPPLDKPASAVALVDITLTNVSRTQTRCGPGPHATTKHDVPGMSRELVLVVLALVAGIIYLLRLVRSKWIAPRAFPKI